MAISAFLLLALTAGPVALQTAGEDRYPVRQLTTHPAQEGFPSWAPDGTRIVYSGGAIDDTLGLWTVAPDGSDRRRLTTEIGEHPVWSPDGRYIAFDADTGNTIKLVSSQGGTPIRFLPSAFAIVHGGNPLWMPDAAALLFEESPNLRILELSTGTSRVLLSDPGAVFVPCCILPGGNEVLYWYRPPGMRESSLRGVALTGETRDVLPLTGGKAYRYADCSPDGTLIAYTECEGRTCDIWVMPASGGNAVRLTYHPAVDESPRWSPCGTMIAFTSTRARSFDVWVMDVDLDDLRRALGINQP